MKLFLVCIIAVFTLNGCVSTKEVFYTGIQYPEKKLPDTSSSDDDVDVSGEANHRETMRSPKEPQSSHPWPYRSVPTQFYRYSVSLRSIFSKVRFEAGYFDRQTVDRIFSEGHLELTSGFPSDQTDTKEDSEKTRTVWTYSKNRKATIFGPEGDRDDPSETRFVMIFSSNPGTFSSRVNMLITNQSIAQNLEKIINRDVYLRHYEVSSNYSRFLRENYKYQNYLRSLNTEDIEDDDAFVKAIDTVVSIASTLEIDLPQIVISTKINGKVEVKKNFVLELTLEILTKNKKSCSTPRTRPQSTELSNSRFRKRKSHVRITPMHKGAATYAKPVKNPHNHPHSNSGNAFQLYARAVELCRMLRL